MNTSTAPIYLQYELRLRSPAIVSNLSGNPNSAATQPFIPGGVIRGVLAGRLLADGFDGGGEDFRRLIITGDVRYLHAYPPLAGERTLPTPSSWKSQKDDGYSVFDLPAYSGSICADDDPDDIDWPQEALATVSNPFRAASGTGGMMTTPRRGSRLHQQRDRERGRPWTKRKGKTEERRGVLFTYEYLEAEQVFSGVIQVMPKATADIGRIKRLLSTAPILIGHSRRAGYGGEASVEFTGQTRREYENVANAISQDVRVGTRFRALVTSAYLGRHPSTGQIDPSALQHELSRRLGDAAEVVRTRWTFEIVGTFNRKWRLELPQSQAVAAGAVLVLEATSAIPATTLQTLEHHGMGERRAEGFGRMLFVQHYEGHNAIRLTSERHGLVEHGDYCQVETASEIDRHTLHFLEQRIVLAAARAEIKRVATLDLAARAEGTLPTNSLLRRLQTLFRQSVNEQAACSALSNLRSWCSDDAKHEALATSARNQLDRCMVGGSAFREWLYRLAEGPEGEAGWTALVDASGTQSTLTSLAASKRLTSGGNSEAILHSHSALLRVHLIDAVFNTMAHMNRRTAR